MFRKIIIFICSIFFIFTSACHANSHIIVFGDSLSDAGMNTPDADTGNNTRAHADGHTGAPFTNLDTQTNTHPLWINYFFEKKFPGEKLWPWRLAAMQNIDPATHNINYAYASSETGHWLDDNTGSAFPPYVDAACHSPGKMSDNLYCVPGVLQQVRIYLQAVPHPDPQTVFIIWAGGNDIFNNIIKITGFFQKKNLQDAGTQLATFATEIFNSSPDKINIQFPALPELSWPVINLVKVRNELVAAGVKPAQIYFIDLPDLSRTPAALSLAAGNKIVLGILHGITAEFNISLRLALSQNIFDSRNIPAGNIYSSWEMLNTLLDMPAKYGFTQISHSCVQDGKAPVCAGYVFYNNKHPTVQTGKFIAESLTG